MPMAFGSSGVVDCGHKGVRGVEEFALSELVE